MSLISYMTIGFVTLALQLEDSKIEVQILKNKDTSFLVFWKQ